MEIARPFYFTDPAGTKTVEIDEVDAIVDDLGISSLTGKIWFRDPTFGGVFPELTNANIWTTIESLQGIGPKLGEVCENTPDGDFRCRKILSADPSDLDVWAYHLMWLDELL